MRLRGAIALVLGKGYCPSRESGLSKTQLSSSLILFGVLFQKLQKH